MREAVVVLAPDVRREQVVERGDRPSPADPARHLQPLRVLVEHRVDDVDEGLVAVEQPVPAGEQVALEPALAEVLGEHLHDAAVRGEVVIGGEDLGVPGPVGDLEHGREPVRRRLVRAHDPEAIGVCRRHVAQPFSEHAGRFAGGPRRGADLDRVATEVGQLELAQEQTAVGVRVGAHPALAARGQGGEVGPQRTSLDRTAPRGGRSASTPRARQGARDPRAPVRAVPGGSGTSPRPADRRPSSAPSTPSASGARSSARPAAGPLARSSWIAPISPSDLVEGRGHQLVHLLGLGSRRRIAARSRSPRAARSARARRSVRAQSGWRSCSR